MSNRSDDGFLENYNYHDWSKFMVSPKNLPKDPHFAAVLFETETRYEPDYHDRGSAVPYTTTATQYFAFPDKKTLEAWLLRATKESKKFFFFEVKRVGEVQLKVAIETDT